VCSYIEAVVAEESDSLLSKAGDMVSSLASRDATSVLVIKPDEEFISVRAFRHVCALGGLL
jgi:hypothetical protein